MKLNTSASIHSLLNKRNKKDEKRNRKWKLSCHGKVYNLPTSCATLLSHAEVLFCYAIFISIKKLLFWVWIWACCHWVSYFRQIDARSKHFLIETKDSKEEKSTDGSFEISDPLNRMQSYGKSKYGNLLGKPFKSFFLPNILVWGSFLPELLISFLFSYMENGSCCVLWPESDEEWHRWYHLIRL